MAKKHIISFGYREFAVDSVTAATAAVALLSKLIPVRQNMDSDRSSGWFYEPDSDRDVTIKLKMNEEFREPKPAKPEKAPKPLALPKPARGTIRCICEKSDVAPKQSCAHCGRPFSESHNRTHQGDSIPSHPTLRLL